MPVPLPVRGLSKTHSDQQPSEWIGFWALSLGIAAVCLASLIYFTSEDAVAASFVLAAFAAIIGVVLREAMREFDRV